jgi:signal transduction histidine kinase
MGPSAFWLGVLAVAGAALIALAARAVPHWDEPLGVSFSAVAYTTGAIGLGAAVAQVTWAPIPGRVFFYDVIGLSWFVFPFLWVVFALEYLGRTEIVSPRYLAAMAAPGAVSLGLHFLRTFAPLGLLSARGWGAASLSITVLLLGGLSAVVVVSALIARASYRHEYVDPGRGVALALAGLAQTVTFVVLTVALTLDPEPGSLSHGVVVADTVAWLVTAVCLGVVGRSFDTFESVPAASAVSADMVVAEMDDPVLVVNTDGEVLELNPAATAALDTTECGIAGSPLQAVVGHSLSTLERGDTVEIRTEAGGRQYEPAVSTLTDQYDRPLGYAVALHDVTERRQRELRLSILNRVLRHNVRNDMTAVLTSVDCLEAGQATDDAISNIRAGATDVVELSEKARELQRLMALDPDPEQTVSVRSTVDRAVEAVREEYGAIDVLVAVDPGRTVRADSRLLDPVVRNVVENAIEHSDDPTVHVTARRDGDTVVLSVVDDGPGLSEHERRVLDGGVETPLEHGSGLGLWTVQWGVSRLGGTLSFADADHGGTAVHIGLPAGDTSTSAVLSANADDSPGSTDRWTAGDGDPSVAEQGHVPASGEFGDSSRVDD